MYHIQIAYFIFSILIYFGFIIFLYILYIFSCFPYTNKYVPEHLFEYPEHVVRTPEADGARVAPATPNDTPHWVFEDDVLCLFGQAALGLRTTCSRYLGIWTALHNRISYVLYILYILDILCVLYIIYFIDLVYFV